MERARERTHTCQGQIFLSQSFFAIYLTVFFVVKQLLHYLGKWQVTLDAWCSCYQHKTKTKRRLAW